jgi:hypothetical protein
MVHAGGRPQEHDRIQIGNDLVNWAKTNSNAFTIPQFATSIGLHSEILRNWCKTDNQFRSLYMQAKELIGYNRLNSNLNKELSDTTYNKTLYHYDYDLREDSREEKSFDNDLKKHLAEFEAKLRSADGLVDENLTSQFEALMNQVSSLQKSVKSSSKIKSTESKS